MSLAVQKIQCLDEEKKQLLKNTLCKGSSDDEFSMFLMACTRTGLDPFMKQIYAIPRWDKKIGKNVYVIQISIDGFRLVAERTGNYSPGREPSYAYDENKRLFSCTAYVKKRSNDGTWHEVSACAHFEEYVQKDKEGKVTQFWHKMPHVMLAKCAESLALRKAFPADLSGLYTSDEMGQADIAVDLDHTTGEIKQVRGPAVNEKQCCELYTWFEEFPGAVKEICDKYGLKDVYDLEQKDFLSVITVLERRKKNKEKA